jgi:hypothetical protein
MSSSVSLYKQEDATSTNNLPRSTNKTSAIASASITIPFHPDNSTVHPVSGSSTVHPVPGSDDISQAERDRMGYGKANHDIIKAQNNLTIKVMKGGHSPELFGLCFQGLKHRQAVTK